MVGAAVVVVVGTVEEVGRSGRTAVADVVVVGFGVVDERVEEVVMGEEDAVVVEVTDVTAVIVEVAVVASVLTVAGMGGALATADDEVVELLGG